MARPAAPPARDSFADAVAAAAAFRDASFEERYQALAAACDLAWAMLAAQPRRAELLALRDPVPEENLRHLERLRARWAERRGW